MSERFSSIQLGAPGEEISLRDLRAVSERFIKLHQLKRDSIRRVLSIGQQQFLDVLPLILNANHPALPGYISGEIPAGIFAYHPDARALDAARQLNPSFNPQPLNSSHGNAIDGLFLMGSVGSMAFTKASDIDIWLCHSADLDPHQLEKLQKKTKALEAWAASLHLEVHFFLINSTQFLLDQKTPVSADSSGETQHYLLLEEFYRTSVYIAGKILSWWLVPPEHEKNYKDYLAHLRERRFIDVNQILDLGGLSQVPANEFISATYWHIYKALQSPYKSLLKLSLMECYASEYPQIDWLCVEIKRAVYQGQITGLDIDPYFLMYRKVEDYLLTSQNRERLSLIQHIFYRKVLEAGDLHPLSAGHLLTPELRERVMRRQGADILELEDQNQQPKEIEKLLHEHESIVQQLATCFHKITSFANNPMDPPFQESRDLALLGRKLLSFFEKQQGKIEIMTPRLSRPLLNQNLSIVENRQDEGWGLRLDGSAQKILYRRRTLIELLCWLSVNGLCADYLSIRFEAGTFSISPHELAAILERLSGFFTRHLDIADSLEDYAGSNALTQSMLIINLGMAAEHAESDHYVISDRSDPFSYGMHRECLIKTIERVSLTRWNEVFCSHYQGLEGLLDCLIDIVQNARPPISRNRFTVFCSNTPRAKSIVHRIDQLFDGLSALLMKAPPDVSPRYIASCGDHYFIFATKDSAISYRQFENETQLLRALSAPRQHFGSVGFDETMLAHSLLPLLYAENRPETVQIFIHQHVENATVYLLDENGALYRRQHKNSTPQQLLNQYALFLHSAQKRRAKTAAATEYYQVVKSSTGVCFCKPIECTLPASTGDLGIRINGSHSLNMANLSIYWNKNEFRSEQYGDRLFRTVRERIEEFRQDKQNYPIYITDIDLPFAHSLQTIQFLEVKEKIEGYLNGEAH